MSLIARRISLVAKGRPRRAKAWSRRSGSASTAGRWSTRVVDTPRFSAHRAARPCGRGAMRKFGGSNLLGGHGQLRAARLAPARVAVAEVPLEPPLVAHADGGVDALGEDGPHALAALAADE